MSDIPKISDQERNQLLDRYIAFDTCANRTSCSTAAASFIMIGALIVIGGSGLCLTLPGINALNQVILPGILPGSLALLLDIPLIIYSVRKAREQVGLRQILISTLHGLLTNYEVHALITEKERQRGVDFVFNNLFPRNWRAQWSKEYANQVLTEIKDLYPKKEEQNQNEQNLVKILTEASEQINQMPKVDKHT